MPRQNSVLGLTAESICLHARRSSRSQNANNCETGDVPRIFTDDGGLMILVSWRWARGKCRERATSVQVITPGFMRTRDVKAGH